MTEEQLILVGCPCCKNKRLFDIIPNTTDAIVIKCQRCGNVIQVIFKKKKVRTGQIGV